MLNERESLIARVERDRMNEAFRLPVAEGLRRIYSEMHDQYSPVRPERLHWSEMEDTRVD